MDLNANFRENLRRACERNKISQRQLSELSGVHWVTVCKMLGGKHPNPSVAICERLARAAGIDPTWDAFAPPDLVIVYE